MSAPLRIRGMEAEQVERSCTSKNRYPDMYTAIAMGITQSEISGFKIYTYRCRLCKGYHLTKSKHSRNGNPVTKCSLKSF